MKIFLNNIYTTPKLKSNKTQNSQKQPDSKSFTNSLALNFYNTNFTAREKAVYAIDDDFNYQRFESRKEAAEKLGVNSSNTTICTNANYKKLKGYHFVNASSVEYTDKDGNTVLDEEELKKTVAVSNSKRKIKKAIYVIDKDFNCQRFESTEAAADKLGIEKEDIMKCLNGQRKDSNGCFFLRAKGIESVDYDGNISVNKEKIKFILRAVKNETIKKGLYACDDELNYTRFEDKKSAAEILGVSDGALSNCLNGTQKQTGGYYFTKAVFVESLDKDGNIVFDKRKLKNIINEIRNEKI